MYKVVTRTVAQARLLFATDLLRSSYGPVYHDTGCTVVAQDHLIVDSNCSSILSGSFLFRKHGDNITGALTTLNS